MVWRAHVKEMSDLGAEQRQHLMAVVFAVEEVLRTTLRPDKINLASLGNQVPHLHWHVIPRFVDDAHFPDPIWAATRREGQVHTVDPAVLRQRLGIRLSPPEKGTFQGVGLSNPRITGGIRHDSRTYPDYIVVPDGDYGDQPEELRLGSNDGHPG